MERRTSVVAGVALVVVTILATPSVAVRTGADGATVDGPVSGGKGTPQLAATNFDLGSVGYEQAEYFIAGTTTAYTSAAPLTADGKWTVTPGDRAPYKTRLVVYRPSDPKHFNGTVLVEWLNVSGGLDAAPIWIVAHDELIRHGYAWVGVSAQRVGVAGGGRALVAGLDLQHADPERYSTLVHPGDSFSYGIYTQAGRAIRTRTATLLGALKPKRVIGIGESQSAFRLTTYIDALHPLAKQYDGYLVYSRGDDGAALSQEPQPAIAAPNPTRIRADLDVPVLTFTTETDLAILGYRAARQPDNAKFRDWEVAGTAHADTYMLAVAGTDTGSIDGDRAFFETMLAPPSSLYGGFFSCNQPINAGPMTYVARAAVDALDRWVATGTPPPKAPRLAIGAAPAGQFRLDAHGNVEGGIRTPYVDVPVAKLSGVGQSGNGFCSIFGTTAPFDTAELASFYRTHAAFVKAWNAATDKAVKAGFVLPADAAAIKAAAARSAVGS